MIPETSLRTHTSPVSYAMFQQTRQNPWIYLPGLHFGAIRITKNPSLLMSYNWSTKIRSKRCEIITKKRLSKA